METWKKEKIPNCENFQLSDQTNSALQRTLRCHAALIEDLLEIDGYKSVLTARFQSDPLEKRYGQYRQMSGGRFLVSLKETMCCENILKMKSILKEGLDVNADLKVDTSHDPSEFEVLRERISKINYDLVALSEDGKDVAVYVAGYVAHKLHNKFKDCCSHMLLGNHCTNDSYVKRLSRGGLKVPSNELSSYVSKAFAILDASTAIVYTSNLTARDGAEFVLRETMSSFQGFACEKDITPVCNLINRIITNLFFNNKRKITTYSKVDDRVKAFKKSKREK